MHLFEGKGGKRLLRKAGLFRDGSRWAAIISTAGMLLYYSKYKKGGVFGAWRSCIVCSTCKMYTFN